MNTSLTGTKDASSLLKTDGNEQSRLYKWEDFLKALESNKALTSLDLLESTYMFYTADNGYHQGEHRLTPGKCGTSLSFLFSVSPKDLSLRKLRSLLLLAEPFESDVHLTNWVRGPGIKPGQVSYVP